MFKVTEYAALMVVFVSLSHSLYQKQTFYWSRIIYVHVHEYRHAESHNAWKRCYSDTFG